MKSESLHALIIDHHFGELAPDVAELLEDYLHDHPEAEAERHKILAALDAAGRATYRFPHLVQFNPASVSATPAVRWRFATHTWLKAAAVVAFASISGSVGYFAGRSELTSSIRTAPALASGVMMKSSSSPWARYRMTPSPSGAGFRVTRIDTPHSTPTSEE